MIYLDYNAGAPLRPEAKAAMIAAMELVGNPSSVHGAGRAARRTLELARRQVAALVQVAPDQVIFTSGATESNNMVFKGLSADCLIFTSAVEHDCVIDSTPDAQRIPVTNTGLVDLIALDQILADARAKNPRRLILLSAMAVNNETGVVQPITEIATIAQVHDVSLHCDAVQAVGKIQLPEMTGALESMSISAHKIGGPKGVGALIIGEKFDLKPLIHGGGQERRKRSGTENLLGIAGFGAAAEVSAKEVDQLHALKKMRDDFEWDVKQSVPTVQVMGEDAPRVAGVSNIALPNIKAETQVMAMDLAGFSISAGSACSSGKVKQSHVLAAMDYAPDVAGCAIRVSIGWDSDADDLVAFLKSYAAYADKVKGR